MKKATSGRNLYSNLEIMPIWKCCPLIFSFICQDPIIARAYTAQNSTKMHFSLVSLGVYPRSRQGAERIRQGEGRWSLPSKTALERSDLTEKSQFRESHTESETKQTPERIPSQKKYHIYQVYIYITCVGDRRNVGRRPYFVFLRLKGGASRGGEGLMRPQGRKWVGPPSLLDYRALLQCSMMPGRRG